MKKQILIAGVVAATASAAGLVGANVASAETHEPGYGWRGAQIADRTADRQTQVDQMVDDGKLTREQAEKITAKRAELQAQREANRAENVNLSAEERQVLMSEHRAALTAWMSENDIPNEYQYLLGGGRGNGAGATSHQGMKRGQGFGRGHGSTQS